VEDLGRAGLAPRLAPGFEVHLGRLDEQLRLLFQLLLLEKIDRSRKIIKTVRILL